MTAQAQGNEAVNKAVAALFHQMAQMALEGRITEVFFWFRHASGDADYDYVVYDQPDMLYDLGSVILLERVDPRKEEAPR